MARMAEHWRKDAPVTAFVSDLIDLPGGAARSVWDFSGLLGGNKRAARDANAALKRFQREAAELDKERKRIAARRKVEDAMREALRMAQEQREQQLAEERLMAENEGRWAQMAGAERSMGLDLSHPGTDWANQEANRVAAKYESDLAFVQSPQAVSDNDLYSAHEATTDSAAQATMAQQRQGVVTQGRSWDEVMDTGNAERNGKDALARYYEQERLRQIAARRRNPLTGF